MLTPAPSPNLPLLQRRVMRVLVVAQLLGSLGLAAGGTAGSLLAEHLTGNPAAAGLPLSLLVLGSGVGAVAVARVMRDHGRRVGLVAAYLAGIVGAALVVAAAGWGSWRLLLAGSLLFGGGNTAVMLARYAAVDLASHRGRSISAVVAAASVGAVAGPNLLGPAGPLAEAVGLPAPTGLYLLAMPAFLSAALVLAVFLRPDPLHVARNAARSPEPPAAGGRGELATLLGDRHIRLALLVLAIANLVMVGMMAVAPVHLDHHGAAMGAIGLIVGIHIGAMYLPSPLSGWLSDRFGARLVAALGGLLLLAAGIVAAVAGSGQLGIVVALLLLGIGWNAGLIGGSALLREAPVSPSLRTRAEGLGELGMGAAAAAGGGGAGLLLAGGGLGLLALVAAAPCLLLLTVLVATGRRQAGAPSARPALGPPVPERVDR
jgi:MFS family permease